MNDVIGSLLIYSDIILRKYVIVRDYQDFKYNFKYRGKNKIAFLILIIDKWFLETESNFRSRNVHNNNSGYFFLSFQALHENYRIMESNMGDDTLIFKEQYFSD